MPDEPQDAAPARGHDRSADWRAIAMGLSLAIAALMLGGKLTAYFLTNSAAILSDAAESVVHVFATGIAAFSLWWSRQEACERHPYGHGKVAYFSAGFEGALILVAACYIFYQGVYDLLFGAELTRLGLGLAITGGLALVNLALGLLLVGVGKRSNALILVANGKHVLTDVWTSGGVVVGVGLVWLTGVRWLDPAVAILVAANILWSAGKLIHNALQGLLDEADPATTRTLRETLDHCVEGGLLEGYHQLRHRMSNDVLWVEVHLLLPGDLTLREGHALVNQVEAAIHRAFPLLTVQMTAHAEPRHHDTAHPKGHPGVADPYDGADNGEA